LRNNSEGRISHLLRGGSWKFTRHILHAYLNILFSPLTGTAHAKLTDYLTWYVILPHITSTHVPSTKFEIYH